MSIENDNSLSVIYPILLKTELTTVRAETLFRLNFPLTWITENKLEQEIKNKGDEFWLEEKLRNF